MFGRVLNMLLIVCILSLIRQKGESQNGGNKEIKHAEFSEKGIFLTP